MKLIRFLLLPFFVRAATYNVAIRDEKKQVCRGIMVSRNTVLTLSSCIRDDVKVVDSEKESVSPLYIERHPSKDLALVRTDFGATHPVLTIADQEFPYSAAGQMVDFEFKGKTERVLRSRKIYKCSSNLCIYRRRKYKHSCRYLRGSPFFLQIPGMNVTAGLLSRGCLTRKWKSSFIPLVNEKEWVQDFAQRRLPKSPDLCAAR